MRRSAAALLLAAAAISGPARPEGVDGRGGRFEDDLISRLEGRWKVSRQIRGTVVENDLTATWSLGHQFLRIEMRDTKHPPAYEALVLIGYVHATKEYVALWADNFGGRYAAIGKGRRSGNSIEFRFEYPDGPFFNTFTWNPDARTWQFRGENQDAGGSRRLFALDTLTAVEPRRPE